MPISKTELLQLKKCPNWFWLSLNEPGSVADQVSGNALASEGMAFEVFARKRFPQGILLRSFGEPAVHKTQELLDVGKEYLFQATALHDDFLVKADVLERNDNGKFNLYEVKASTDIKDDYLLDIAIQRTVFNDAGLEIENCYLIILNSSYVRCGEPDVDQALAVCDVTAQARALEMVDVRPLMAEAKRIAQLADIPEKDIANLSCWPNGASRCPCSEVTYKDLPDYSVFDITRITRDDCSKLLRKGITSIDQMKKDSIKLGRPQATQVVLTQKQLRRVDENRLASELGKLRYPLYFLDYETYNFALPRLDGFSPYQHYVFQYSLHIQDSPDSELQHHEFLATGISLADLSGLASSLQAAILDDDGNVIVWHRQFEEMRNAEMGILFPNYKSFFGKLNRRIFDLEEIFKQGIFLDFQFKGRTSIKAILPVLCPRFSYSDLNVQQGSQAMDAWYEMISGELGESERIQRQTDLLEYCKLDTLAMVEILRKLNLTKRVATEPSDIGNGAT